MNHSDAVCYMGLMYHSGISDYTFMGLPVNENHYEEWKEKLGYTEDDTLEDSAFTTYETEYGLVSRDKKIMRLI